MRYCKKCIMPETYPGISFNQDGICNFCLDYRPYHKYWGKEKLIEVLNSKKYTGQHDCVIPMSGGKDSTYILYYAVRQLRLSPIAVTYDSGFQLEIAKENMRNACKILGIPLKVVESTGNIQTKLLRESFLISKKVGYLMYYCGNCEAIIRTVAINAARTYGAPFILWGATAQETFGYEGYEQYRGLGKRKKVTFISFVTKIRSKFEALLRAPKKIYKIWKKLYPYAGYHSVKYDIFSIFQRLRLNVPIKYALRPHSVPPFTEDNPRFIHFYDYIFVDSKTIVRILKDELNWQNPVDKDMRFDCQIHCLANYHYLTSYGISHDGVNSCNLIRENGLTREEVMAKENIIRHSVGRECKEIIERIGFKNYRMP